MIKGRVLATVTGITAILLLSACAAPPPPPPPPAPIPGPQSISEKTLLTMAADQTFPSGGFTLTKAGKAKLDGLIPALQALGPNAKVVVYGYTDNQKVGKALLAKGIVDNLDLSSKRANEVVRYLVSKGGNPAKISSKGRGEEHPVVSNDTKQGRAQNRRIEVVVEQPTG
jgi:outer membrane protein OmpA-like peptidoglycan-associated protein